MNDSIRMTLIRVIAGLFLTIGFASAHAEDVTDTTTAESVEQIDMADALAPIEFEMPSLETFTIVVPEPTPIEKIQDETTVFLSNMRKELDRTAGGLSYQWYKAQVNLAEEVKCLAQNIYYEARGEDVAGQIAVALVTINRVKVEDFPPTICGVVFQRVKNARGKWVAQFTWTRNHRKTYTPHDQEKWAQAVTIAEYVLRGGTLDNITDITNGSMFYHATYVHPQKWKKYYDKTLRIGNHIFFKSKKDLEYRSDPVVMAMN